MKSDYPDGNTHGEALQSHGERQTETDRQTDSQVDKSPSHPSVLAEPSLPAAAAKAPDM